MIQPGAFKGIGIPVVGAYKSLAAPIGIGGCCCAGEYKSVWFFIACSLPAQPVTHGTIRLYKEITGSGNQDVERPLDITPIQNQTIAQVYNTDFELNFTENGQPVGKLIYEYISGPSGGPLDNTILCNITIEYGGHIYRAENCTAKLTYINPPDGQITLDRTPIF